MRTAEPHASAGSAAGELVRLRAELDEARRALALFKEEQQREFGDQRVWLEREILERRQTAKALQESEQRLETALAGSPVTLFTQDGGLRYTWIYNSVTDWRHSRIIGQTDEDLFGAEDGGRLRRLKNEVLQSGAQRREVVSLPVDGERRWFTLTVNPLRGDDGRVVGVICASVDITDIKRLEGRIAESEARYRAIVEAFDGMIYICSEDYAIEFMNAKLVARCGTPGIGQKCHKVLHGLDQPCPWCRNERVLRGETVHWEVQSPLDGRWYYVVNTPIRHEDGTHAKMAAIMDITERKEAERHRDEMFRTMQRAQHIESLARLTGNIAHHFNNQLTVILGNTDLARAELPGEHPVHAFLEDIKTAAETAARLSDEMLKCSGHALTELKPGNLGALVESARALLAVITAPRIRLVLRMAEGLPDTLMDSKLIQQVLLNLVTNGVEAIGGRTGRIEVETRLVELSADAIERLKPHGPPRPGRHVCLSVTDSGDGIPDGQMAGLFDPFSSTKGVGRGLGLPVALGIAETHRGGLEIISTPGVGVTARLYLPVHTPPDAA